jgi:RHH-type proline utilization regulon transcriptional repressor/proline dehydrogenase/delta 1-pyrroline-5-carboxylate dehydrogenase
MNTLDTPAQMDTAHTDGYITEFKEKSEFEQRINTAWRRAELKRLNNLQKQQIFLLILIKKFMN